LYFCRGQAYTEKEEYGPAIDNFSKCLEMKPGYIQGHFFRACTWRDAEDYQKAKKGFKETLQLAKQQGEKEVVKIIEREIGRFPKES